MAIDTTVFDLDLAAIVADLPASLAWKTFAAVPCSATELSQAQNLLVAGPLDVVHYEVIFRASLVTGYPKPTQRVSITPYGSTKATNYEVVDAKLSQDGVAIHLIVKADHRNGTVGSGGDFNADFGNDFST